MKKKLANLDYNHISIITHTYPKSTEEYLIYIVGNIIMY